MRRDNPRNCISFLKKYSCSKHTHSGLAYGTKPYSASLRDISMGARLRYNNPGQGNLKNAWVASNEPAGKKVLAPRPLGVGSSGWVLLCWTRLVSRHTATSPLRGEGPTVTVGGGDCVACFRSITLATEIQRCPGRFRTRSKQHSGCNPEQMPLGKGWHPLIWVRHQPSPFPHCLIFFGWLHRQAGTFFQLKPERSADTD